MGNLIFATVLLAIAVIFTGVNSLIICNICDDIIGLLDENKIAEACSLWEEKRGYIAVFVRDAEIDVVDAEAGGLTEDISYEDGEAEAGKMKLRDAVIEIRNSEKPNFQNIF